MGLSPHGYVPFSNKGQQKEHTSESRSSELRCKRASRIKQTNKQKKRLHHHLAAASPSDFPVEPTAEKKKKQQNEHLSCGLMKADAAQSNTR